MLLPLAVIFCGALLTVLFTSLTYALRDYSRAHLEAYLEAHRKAEWFERTVKYGDDLIYVTAVGRMTANILIILGSLRLFDGFGLATIPKYALATLVAAAVSLIFAVSLPTALARYLGEPMIALFVRPLHLLRVVLSPLTRVMRVTDRLVLRLIGKRPDPEPELIEKDILEAVEEGEKEGVVDKQERRMIESVIEFRDTEAGQIMTSRPEIIALEVGAELADVKRTAEESGHSRIPVYDGTLDHIVGVLYARDLLRHLGQPAAQFDIRQAMRPAIFVPETKLLRDLLKEFREKKVHMAIVLDEYGGTAGLVTIEDILEELVGEISDEHEPTGLPMFKKVGERTYEVDARMYVGDLNRRCGLAVPEDAGFDTVGGFVSNALGRIPQRGATFEQSGVRFTVTDAEPQRVKRVRLELLPQPQAVSNEARR